MRRLLPILLLSLALSLPLAGCGKRGDLEMPEGQQRDYPRTYPPR